MFLIRKFTALLTATVVVALSACTTLGASGSAADPSFCAVAHPITWAQGDTDATILEVKMFNARGVELCGW